jgi:colanic acid biosynthesis glycosyl transferase WcaI
VAALHAADLFVITERSGSGSSYMPSKLIPAIASGTPVLAVCDDESSLGQEMTRAQLGPRLGWDDLDQLEAVLAATPGQLAGWQANGVARAAAFEREHVVDRIEKLLAAAASGRESTPLELDEGVVELEPTV